ncbi:hypothetical protein SAY86_021184 [Trapa natans]|uniref:Late embryogenesis abundant protein n=1 Tax=Trapa natans TaxID=22666 RepID=A0AAN7M9I9_TRANT|nr:hypothetical protein SAY86_021184 [Trapa natans]
MAKDMESFQSQEEKRRKRMRLAAYIGAFAVFQVIVILVFALVVMRVKTPKFRVGDGIAIHGLETVSGLGSELKSGVLTLNSGGRLNGKVELMFIFKKKKSADMNCSISINVASKAVQSVTCD